MKAFWDNLFYDLGNGLSMEDFAQLAGKGIRGDFQDIENAIENYDLKKALKLIREAKESY